MPSRGYPPSKPSAFSKTQLIFVKNVPQESTPNVSALYIPYKPLDIRNLYPSGRITTLMIVLPSERIAVTALKCTDGMRVDSTIIGVERYNRRQSTVARREMRGRRSNGGVQASEEKYDDYGVEYDVYGDDNEGYEEAYDTEEPEQEDVPDNWEDEAEPCASEESLAVQQEASKADGVSWADVTKGVSPKTLSPSPVTPIATPQTPVATPTAKWAQAWQLPREELGTVSFPSAPVDEPSQFWSPNGNGFNTASTANGARIAVPSVVGLPQIKVTPVTLVPDLGISPTGLKQPLFAGAPSSQDVSTAPQHSRLTRSSSSNGSAYQYFSQAIPNVSQQQRRPLGLWTDTTAIIQSRHCAGCSFCKFRQQRKKSL